MVLEVHGVVGCCSPPNVPWVQAPALVTYKVSGNVPRPGRAISPPADQGRHVHPSARLGTGVAAQSPVFSLKVLGGLKFLLDVLRDILKADQPAGIWHLGQAAGGPPFVGLPRL